MYLVTLKYYKYSLIYLPFFSSFSLEASMMSDNKDNQVATISKKMRGDAEMDTENNAAEEE
jgi:hypothetical protein